VFCVFGITGQVSSFLCILFLLLLIVLLFLRLAAPACTLFSPPFSSRLGIDCLAQHDCLHLSRPCRRASRLGAIPKTVFNCLRELHLHPNQPLRPSSRCSCRSYCCCCCWLLLASLNIRLCPALHPPPPPTPHHLHACRVHSSSANKGAVNPLVQLAVTSGAGDLLRATAANLASRYLERLVLAASARATSFLRTLVHCQESLTGAFRFQS